MSRRKLTWGKSEDNLLRETLAKFKVQQLPNGHSVLEGSWSDVASHMAGRSAKQCRERWCYNLCPSINRAPWTVEEDAQLLQTQLQYGNHWSLIARQVRGRTGDNVKIRFKSIVRASRRMWTRDEDARLQALHQFVGPNWDFIAHKLGGRTRNAVRNRYQTLADERANSKPPAPHAGAPEQIFHHERYAPLTDALVRRTLEGGACTARAGAELPREGRTDGGKNSDADDEEGDEDASTGSGSDCSGARVSAGSNKRARIDDNDDARSHGSTDAASAPSSTPRALKAARRASPHSDTALNLNALNLLPGLALSPQAGMPLHNPLRNPLHASQMQTLASSLGLSLGLHFSPTMSPPPPQQQQQQQHKGNMTLSHLQLPAQLAIQLAELRRSFGSPPQQQQQQQQVEGGAMGLEALDSFVRARCGGDSGSGGDADAPDMTPRSPSMTQLLAVAAAEKQQHRGA